MENEIYYVADVFDRARLQTYKTEAQIIKASERVTKIMKTALARIWAGQPQRQTLKDMALIRACKLTLRRLSTLAPSSPEVQKDLEVSEILEDMTEKSVSERILSQVNEWISQNLHWFPEEDELF